MHASLSSSMITAPLSTRHRDTKPAKPHHSKPAVVLDIGDEYIKCGFAGESAPRGIYPTLLTPSMATEPYNPLSSPYGLMMNPVVNPEPLPAVPSQKLYLALGLQGLTAAQWAHMFAKLFRTIYFDYLMVNPNERRVVICENPFWPHFIKTAMATALFDLEVPGVWFTSSLHMALYASGDATGMVMDIGMAEVRLLPVVDGWPLDSMARCIPLGTRNLFGNFRTLLRTAGTSAVAVAASEEKKDDASHQYSEEIIEDMIARTVQVRPIATATSTADAETKAKERTTVTDSKAIVLGESSYALPTDHTTKVSINGNARSYAADCFFGDNTEGLSIAELIADCLLECGTDTRPLLVRRLLLSGGSAFLPGLGPRLITELSNLFLQPRYASLAQLRDRLRLVTPTFPPNILSWIGGSLVSCMELPRKSFLNAKRFADRRHRVPDWTSGSSSSSAALTSSSSASSTSTTPSTSVPGTPNLATPTLTPFGSRLTISVTSTSSGHTRGSSIGNWSGLGPGSAGGSSGSGGVSITSSPSPLSHHRRPLTVVTQIGSPVPSPSPRMHQSQSFGAALSAMRLPTSSTTATAGTSSTSSSSSTSASSSNKDAAGLLSPPHH